MSAASTVGPQVLLVRHGETEWSKSGQHTGSTDLPVTAVGENQARALIPAFAGLEPAAVLVSPRQRARRTAELAGLVPYDVEVDLREWEYGEVEGITTKTWQADHPGWSIWTDGATGGESPADVGRRADRVLARVEQLLDPHRPVVLVAHGHVLRVLAARWLGLEPAAGALFRLDPATLSALGHEHDCRVLLRWNARP